MAEIDVCPVDELPPGHVKIVYAGQISIGVYNLDGEYFALEDRCSHDDGPRHGANIDIRTGRALTLPAVLPVDTFPVRVDAGTVKVEVP